MMKQIQNKKVFRHELKYLISHSEKEVLQQKMSVFMQQDAHAGTNGYFIRSLYFEDRDESAYRDKIAGVNERKKYRIRIYNYSDTQIKLECKRKEGQYINKVAASLIREEYEMLLRGEYEFLRCREEPVCRDFYLECMLHGMRPAVLVDYDREPFVYAYGDVRVTFDSHVRAGYMEFDLFSNQIPVHEVLEDGQLILEVKYTQYLPTVIKELIQPKDSIYIAASKYAMCMEKKKELRGEKIL